ncbi:hypothetical protein GCM10007079_49920 [Nocardiopsis terrae]|uniref:Uncharacterized protein n=1 Tax=Nocardiopsis terrae TaxID=372655 RepID=A0ABR9HK12_9ACTN|nr:hypothetical protein [Nocardiopsis terrae]MBE1459365.1 hypothetical protein [Nocardiopsis terrae]GHC96907.1 hypothetical protein GCM10007079_49920 [Nocardiopsis terrae]
MKWLLKRLLAGLAAILVVLVGAGALLTYQYSGTPGEGAASQGSDAAWVGSWEDTEALEELLGTGGVNTLYVYAGEVAGNGGVERVPGTGDLLAWLGTEFPEVRALAWLRHVESGSSLVRDRFDADARAALAPRIAEVGADGFAGVHLDIRPVTVNDPSLPALMETVREELGAEPVLSVRAHHVELVPGGRVPSFVVGGEEKYWSKGYLERVTEYADEVVLPGVDAGMPVAGMYGGFMVRQVTESVTALRTREDVTVRFGVPAYSSERWGPATGHETALTAIAAVRLGVSRAQVPDTMTLGVALYLVDEAEPEDLTAYRTAWLAP